MTNNNIYEIGMLVNPDLSQQEAKDVVEKVKEIITSKGASVLSEGEPVNVELAYEVVTKIASKNERFNEAYFVWVKFEAETSAIASIKKEVDKIKKDVFRYLITKTVADDDLTDKFTLVEEIEEDEVEESADELSVEEIEEGDTTTDENEENKA